MDHQVRKLQELVKLHFGQSKAELENQYGKSSKNSDNGIWFYRKYRWCIFKEEIAFIFEEDSVIDIAVTEYIFWIEYRNIFYYEGQDPEYKITKLL